MTSKQKTAIWLAVLLVLATSLYPPWTEPRYTFDKEQENELGSTALKMQQDGESIQSIRKFAVDYQHRYGHPHVYHWLFDPSVSSGRVAHVDLSRLAVEWVICLVFSAGLYIAWPTVTRSQFLRLGSGTGTVLMLCLIAFAVVILIGVIWEGIDRSDWRIVGIALAVSLILGKVVWDRS
jgi:hypothetical protein